MNTFSQYIAPYSFTLSQNNGDLLVHNIVHNGQIGSEGNLKFPNDFWDNVREYFGSTQATRIRVDHRLRNSFPGSHFVDKVNGDDEYSRLFLKAHVSASRVKKAVFDNLNAVDNM